MKSLIYKYSFLRHSVSERPAERSSAAGDLTERSSAGGAARSLRPKVASVAPQGRALLFVVRFLFGDALPSSMTLISSALTIFSSSSSFVSMRSGSRSHMADCTEGIVERVCRMAVHML